MRSCQSSKLIVYSRKLSLNISQYLPTLSVITSVNSFNYYPTDKRIEKFLVRGEVNLYLHISGGTKFEEGLAIWNNLPEIGMVVRNREIIFRVASFKTFPKFWSTYATEFEEHLWKFWKLWRKFWNTCRKCWIKFFIIIVKYAKIFRVTFIGNLLRKREFLLQWYSLVHSWRICVLLEL